jgi:hypothetical protein
MRRAASMACIIASAQRTQPRLLHIKLIAHCRQLAKVPPRYPPLLVSGVFQGQLAKTHQADAISTQVALDTPAAEFRRPATDDKTYVTLPRRRRSVLKDDPYSAP